MGYGESPPELTALDHYRIIRKIGRGGQGDVYLAHDPHLDIDVAIKVLHPEYRDQEFVRRLTLEARIMVRLAAPNIVRIFNFNPNYPYLVMEYCADGDLNQFIKSRRPNTLTHWVSLTRQICEALIVAHEQDDPILHRDLKPGNVMFHRGVPKVADFGLAKVLGGASSGMTMSRGMMGTVGYSSPEQLKDASRVDHRTDIWAVGVILYELLTFRGPFERPGDDDFVNTAIRVRTEPPADPPFELPEALWRVILQALEKDPAARFDSARLMARALDEAVAAIPGANEMMLPPESALNELDHLASRAAVSFSSGSIDDARALVEKMKQIAPEDSLARYWDRRLREASSESRRSDSTATGVTDARLRSIRKLVERREYAEARRECGKILIEFPDDGSVHDLLLRIAQEEREIGTALAQARLDASSARDSAQLIEVWRALDERFPDHAEIRGELAIAESQHRAAVRQAAWEAREREVRKLVEAGRFDQAVSLLDDYLTQFPDDARATDQRTALKVEQAERVQSERLAELRREARELADAGALERALVVWRQIIDETPTEEAHREAETLRRAIVERTRQDAIDAARSEADSRIAAQDLPAALAVWQRLQIDLPGDPDVAHEVAEIEKQVAAQEVETLVSRLDSRVATGRYRGLPEAERRLHSRIAAARSALAGDVRELREARESLAVEQAAVDEALRQALDEERQGLSRAFNHAAEMLEESDGDRDKLRSAAEIGLDRALATAAAALSRVPWADDPDDPLAGLREAHARLRDASETLVRERREAIDDARRRARALLDEALAAVAALQALPADEAGEDPQAERWAGELERLGDGADSDSADRLGAVAREALEVRERALAARAIRVARLAAELRRALLESTKFLVDADLERLPSLARSAEEALAVEDAEAEWAALLGELRVEIATARERRQRSEAAARSSWSAALKEVESLAVVPEAASERIEQVRRDGSAALTAARFADVPRRAAELTALVRAARADTFWEAERRAIAAVEGPADEQGVAAEPAGPDDATDLGRLRVAAARGAWDDATALARRLRERAGRGRTADKRQEAVPVPEIDARIRKLNERLHPAALARFDSDAAAYAKARAGSGAQAAEFAAAAVRAREALLRPAPIAPRLVAGAAAIVVIALAVAATLALSRPRPGEVTLVSPADVRIVEVRRDGREVTASLGIAATVTPDGVRWTLEPGEYVVTTEQGAEVRFVAPRNEAVFVPLRVTDPARELTREMGLDELLRD